MERLQALFPEEKVQILIIKETELFLLVENRHIKYEKTNLGFLNSFKFKTLLEVLSNADVANIVRESYLPFYASDIESIIAKEDCFEITIKSDTLIHYGQFIIYKE
ncbi:hypothetical protein [Aeromonas phage AerS_266]|nr:hypothetical protein [Aeromonas phage AerS_266]